MVKRCGRLSLQQGADLWCWAIGCVNQSQCMYVCECVSVCMYVRTYVRTYVCMYVCLNE